jgi:hypothetical protein
MFRHGVRSWTKTYPNEPLPVTVWDSQGGLSVLTNAGIKQMTEYGKFFNKYYKDSIKFRADQTNARTTDVNRTIMSARVFLKAIFGDNSIEINNSPRAKDYVRYFRNKIKM